MLCSSSYISISGLWFLFSLYSIRIIILAFTCLLGEPRMDSHLTSVSFLSRSCLVIGFAIISDLSCIVHRILILVEYLLGQIYRVPATLYTELSVELSS
jgi:hypothetical protein